MNLFFPSLYFFGVGRRGINTGMITSLFGHQFPVLVEDTEVLNKSSLGEGEGWTNLKIHIPSFIFDPISSKIVSS